MRLSRFNEKFYLHDTCLDRFQYILEDKTIILHVDLCNWMQDWYIDDDPDMVSGQIVFTGVSRVWLESQALSNVDFYPDGQIVEVKTNRLNNVLDSWKMFVHVDGQNDFLVLIHASDVIWEQGE